MTDRMIKNEKDEKKRKLMKFIMTYIKTHYFLKIKKIQLLKNVVI